MYKDHWKKLLEAWRNELEASLDLSNAVRIHLVAEEKGKGEIHRVVAIGASRPSAELVITRMISQLADLKLADHDPTTLQIRAVTWVNRSTALDDLGHIRRAKEPIANSDIRRPGLGPVRHDWVGSARLKGSAGSAYLRHDGGEENHIWSDVVQSRIGDARNHAQRFDRYGRSSRTDWCSRCDLGWRQYIEQAAA